METIVNNMETQSIVVRHKTRCMDTAKALKGEDNPCKEYKTTFDFSNCSDKEILELASKTCIISFRTKSKVNTITEDAFAALANETIDVHEALKAERKGLSSEEKIDRLTKDMGKDELAELIKKLSEKRA